VVHQLAQLSTHLTHCLKSAGVGLGKGAGVGGVGGDFQGVLLLLLLLLLPLSVQTRFPDVQSLGALVVGGLGPPGTGADF
jgi:hypothetical protein